MLDLLLATGLNFEFNKPNIPSINTLMVYIYNVRLNLTKHDLNPIVTTEDVKLAMEYCNQRNNGVLIKKLDDTLDAKMKGVPDDIRIPIKKRYVVLTGVAEKTICQNGVID